MRKNLCFILAAILTLCGTSVFTACTDTFNVDNNGGEDDPVGTLVALLGNRTAPDSQRRYSPSWDQNMLTGQYLTKTFVVDRNFDGVFDDRDNETDWVGDLNKHF